MTKSISDDDDDLRACDRYSAVTIERRFVCVCASSGGDHMHLHTYMHVCFRWHHEFDAKIIY